MDEHCMRSIVLAVLTLLLLRPAAAQDDFSIPCGLVDSIGYPVDGIVAGYDDFALYRERFGGLHVGIDLAFDRWGDPVMAVARGRVTYADPDGWDTERGVVIIEHIFPDRTVAYSLYGHVEQTDDITFPTVGTCVEPGEVIASVGWPSRGRPHLHYEIRDFMPDDGGPGYVETNPLAQGWYHPLDFTQLWQVRLGPGFLRSATFQSVPNMPSVALDDGTFALASSDVLQAVTAAGDVLWRVEVSGTITGLAALPGGRIAAHTSSGQAMVLQNGRYLGLWRVEGLDEPFLAVDETLIFAQAGGGLSAFDAVGEPLWTLPPVGSADRVAAFATNGHEIALGLRAEDGGYRLRLIDLTGSVTFETQYEAMPLVAPDPTGGWIAVAGTTVKRLAGGANHDLTTLAPVPGRTAAVSVDLVGNSYLYLGDGARTLLSLDPNGVVRWRAEYPTPPGALPPLLHTGGGCMLYALDRDGGLNVFNTLDGRLLRRVNLYAGGRGSGTPRARLLEVGPAEQIRANPGFLTTIWFDGWALAGLDPADCRLG
jgi:murein DD-endopeptidase MepM/ murein hydrolase activator NlpD